MLRTCEKIDESTSGERSTWICTVTVASVSNDVTNQHSLVELGEELGCEVNENAAV